MRGFAELQKHEPRLLEYLAVVKIGHIERLSQISRIRMTHSHLYLLPLFETEGRLVHGLPI